MLSTHAAVRQFTPQQLINAADILGVIPCGLVVINAQGIIIWFNETAEEFLGNSLQNAQWLDVIQQSFAPKADDGHEISLIDGRRLKVAISPLANLPGQLVTLIDLTTTRDYEQAKANQRRLMALGEMTAQLAHQIRTPLSSAMIFAEHLAAGKEQSRQWPIRIQECLANIESQIQDLLLFARGENLARQPINRIDFSNQLIERVQNLLTEQPVVLHITNEVESRIDYLHAESIIGAVLNLVNNALQAQADCIQLALQAKNDDDLSIQVKDNGCGMPTAVKKQAFDPFYTTKAQGTGLGLAVVQAVISAHQGVIQLESMPNKGSCITLIIPKRT